MYCKILLASALFVVLVFASEAEANGASCQLYGHSCLGGHGKRSDSASEMDSMQPRMNINRMNNLLQRLLARRVMSQSPDLMNSISDYSDLEKRSPDYIPAQLQ